jgi:predicted membrane protein
MEVFQHVEGRLEKKLEYWQKKQNSVLRWVFVFLILVILSFVFNHFFLEMLILTLALALLFFIYCYQRVLILSSIQGHTWTNKNT